jgi:hypothetical protein
VHRDSFDRHYQRFCEIVDGDPDWKKHASRWGLNFDLEFPPEDAFDLGKKVALA